MGLLKRLLQEKKEGGLLQRAVTLKNYEVEPAGGKKKEQEAPAVSPSRTPKKT